MQAVLRQTGGYNVSDAVTYYDPQTNFGALGLQLPEARHHIALLNNNGYLYGVGGFARNENGRWQMRSNNWRLGGINENWVSLRPMPNPQAESVVASLGGFVHVAGGRSPAGSRNREWADHIDTDMHWAYDAADDQWFDLAPLPSPEKLSGGRCCEWRPLCHWRTHGE